MDFSVIGTYISSHLAWATGVVTVLYAVEKLLETIGTVYNIKIIDNIGVYLGNILRALWPNQKPPVGTEGK